MPYVSGRFAPLAIWRVSLRRHMTLSIGKYCGRTGFGIRGLAAVVMRFPGVGFHGAFGMSDCSERRQRTATLIPDWLSFPTSLTLHAAGMACAVGFSVKLPVGLPGCKCV